MADKYLYSGAGGGATGADCFGVTSLDSKAGVFISEGLTVEAAAGPEAVIEAASRPAEWVMAAVVGYAGLAPTLVAARRGAMVALANKEALVCAGRLLTEAIREPRAPDAMVADAPGERRWQRIPLYLRLRAVKQ